MTGCTSDAACTQRTMQPTWKEIVMKTYLEMTKEEQEKRFGRKKEEVEEKKEENRQTMNECYEKGIAETKNMAEKLKNI